MRWAAVILAALVCPSVAVCADESAVAILPCSAAAVSSDCSPSKQDIKKAQQAFARGVKLQHERSFDEAFRQFQSAADLSPKNINYLTARELSRQQLVMDHLERGNNALTIQRPIEALGEFRQALSLDPQNEFAQQRVQDAMAEWAPKSQLATRVSDAGGEIRVEPAATRGDFHFRGESRGLLSQVAATFGVKVTLDDSVTSRPVRFDLGDADFYTAMQVACSVTKTFWSPLSATQILVASESVENHRAFDRMSMRTFYVPTSSPQDLTELNNLLRNLFDIRFITPQPGQGTLTVRAPQNVLDAATKVIENLGDARPQVMLDIKVFEVSHNLTRNMGLQIPNNFQLFNIPAAALLALTGTNIQDAINQLIANGGINQANNQALSALLAQLQSQANSIFSTPVATFGNGQTLEGLSLGTLGAQLSLNESWVKNLQHVTLRAGQGSDTNFHLGSRYPILNATFAPVFNTPAIAQVIQNNTFTAPFPSFNYEDLGLSIKAKTSVSGSSDVGLALEMEIRSLTGENLNGVPFISNREYKGSINLRDNEPAILAGSISHNETRMLSGLPGFGLVPGLNQVTTSNSKEIDEDELLVVITPHVVDQPEREQASEVWLAK
jgi:type II secretory pathway component GspD/PulD (secretin)